MSARMLYCAMANLARATKKVAFCSCCVLPPRLEMSAGFLSVFTQCVSVVGVYLISLIHLFTNLGSSFVDDNYDNTEAEPV